MIGKVISHSFEKNSSYHLPVRTVTSRDDVKYDPDVMHKARWAIAGHVKGRHPVLVGCAMNPQTFDVEGRPFAGDPRWWPYCADRRLQRNSGRVSVR